MIAWWQRGELVKRAPLFDVYIYNKVEKMRFAQCLGLLMALALHTADLRAQTDDQYKMEIGAGVALVSYE